MQKPKPEAAIKARLEKVREQALREGGEALKPPGESHAEQAPDSATAALPKEVEIVDDDSMEEADRLHHMG